MVVLATEADIFSRVFDPVKIRMSAEAARSISRMDFNPADRKRMNELAEKARQGILAPAEDEEFENYIQVGHLLTIMQSKARLRLKSHPENS